MSENMFTPPDMYMMKYHCSNCGETFTQFFKKGERAHQGKCTNCEVEPEYRDRPTKMW